MSKEVRLSVPRDQLFVPPIYGIEELLSEFVEHGTQGQLKFAMFFGGFRLLRFITKTHEAFLKIGDYF
jgi:hypothetical protein